MSEQSILNRLVDARDELRSVTCDLEIYGDMWDMAESVGSDDIIDQINVKRKKLRGREIRLSNLVEKLELQVVGFESRRDPKVKKLQEKVKAYSVKNFELMQKACDRYRDNKESYQEIENLKSSNLELCKVIENLKFENNNLIAKNNKLIKDTTDLAETLKNLSNLWSELKAKKSENSWFDWR